MKKQIVVIVIMFSFFLSGCYGYKDMNKINFSASGIIDREESGEITVYSELFAGDRGDTTQGATSKRVILRGTGATINQAYYTMQRSSTYPMAYDVMKAVMFTERIAKHGLTNHLDTIVRNQKPTIKQFVFILEEDPVEFYKVRLQDEQFTGIFLEDMMVMQGDQQEIFSVRLNEFYNERIQSGKVSLIPTIALCEQPEEMRISITGIAILKNDKMVDKLNIHEVGVYKLMMNEIKQGNLTVENPQDSGHLISLLVLKNKTKNNIVYDGEKAIYKIDVDIDMAILGIEGETKVMDDGKEIVTMASKEIEKRCRDLFSKYQEKDIDLFHIESAFNRKYPHIDASNILENTEIELDVNVNIESSQNITDFER